MYMRTLLTGDRRMPLCIGTPLSRGVLMAAPLRRLVSYTVNRPSVIAIREEGKACLCHLLDLGLSVGSLFGALPENRSVESRTRVSSGDSLRTGIRVGLVIA